MKKYISYIFSFKPKFLIVFCVFLFFVTQTIAQKFGYVDLEYVLNQMPEFKEAEVQLDALTAEWQKEVEEKLKKVDVLVEKYAVDKMLMTEEMIKKRELDIKKLQKDAYSHQAKIFGANGLLFLKRQELIVPLRKEVFYAVEKVAKKENYQMIFDKSAGLVLIYTNPMFDITDKLLTELGLKENDEDNDEEKIN